MPPIIIGPPMLRKMEAASSVQQKDNMVVGTPRRLCMSHSSCNEANFCRKGCSHFRSSGEQIWKLIWNECKIIAQSYWPYMYTKWLSKFISKYSIRWCCQPVQELQKQCHPAVPKGKALTCCNFLPACEESFLTRKEYAYIWRSPHQIETYSLA